MSVEIPLANGSVQAQCHSYKKGFFLLLGARIQSEFQLHLGLHWILPFHLLQGSGLRGLCPRLRERVHTLASRTIEGLPLLINAANPSSCKKSGLDLEG